MADRQAMEAAQVIWDDADTFDLPSDEGVPALAEIISSHYSAKLEAAQKMAEALTLMRECRHMRDCEGCTVRTGEALAAWKESQMTSHEYAAQLHEIAAFIESRPVFEMPDYTTKAWDRIQFFSDKDKFLAAGRAIGSFTKEFDRDDILLIHALPSGAHIDLVAARNLVCRLVKEAEYECEPLLTPEEEKSLG